MCEIVTLNYGTLKTYENNKCKYNGTKSVVDLNTVVNFTRRVYVLQVKPY